MVVQRAAVSLEGIPISSCRVRDVEGLLRQAIETGGAPLTLATVNLDFLRLAHRDRELHYILQHTHHNFADGWPVLYLASVLGHELPERVTGADLTPLICTWAGRHGWRLALVGAGEETRERLAQEIPRRYGPILVGHWTPDYRRRPLRDPDLCREIRAAGAQIVLVALGCPRQEQWIWHNAADAGVAAAMGVGGSLDFMVGIQQRAPRIAQELRLEWLYRALQQPRRLGVRYALDALFFLRILRSTRLRPSASP